MFVMVDVVANHMGYGNIADNRPSPLDQDSSYHPTCDIDYNNQTSIEQCRIASLPDVNTEDGTIRTTYQSWIKWLISEYGFDGIRIDTVKHVHEDFWPGFTSAAAVYSIGEVFSGDPDYVVNWAPAMSGLLNYPVYYPLNAFYQQKGVFAGSGRHAQLGRLQVSAIRLPWVPLSTTTTTHASLMSATTCHSSKMR